MPMKTMKAKSMKTSKVKTIAANTKNLMKRPAKKGDEATALTEFALQKLGGASDNKVEAFLENLDDKEQMRLWKSFERNRQEEGENEIYKTTTCGTGKNRVSRALLKVWIQSGATTKNPVCQDAFLNISSKHEKGKTEVWQPLHYMLNHKFGMRELKARVISGSIEIRANPHDHRFPEFCEVTEYSKKSVSKKTSIHIKSKGEAISWNDFDQLQKMELEIGQDVRFANGPVPEQENPLALTGWSASRGLPVPSPTRSKESATHSISGAQSASSMILATMANSESPASKKSTKEMKMGLLKCKGAVESLMNNLEEHSLGSSKHIQKQIQTGINELKATHKLLNQPRSQSSSLVTCRSW